MVVKMVYLIKRPISNLANNFLRAARKKYESQKVAGAKRTRKKKG